jgi:hypothetical protein
MDFTVEQLLGNEDFVKALATKLGSHKKFQKADTIDQSLNLLWYDLKPIVQLLYPYKQLIPLISKLPRVPANGGNAFHWKRITAINVNNASLGVSEGNRGAAITINLQDQQASYKTLGLESNVSFEARLGAMNLSPDALGSAIQSTLRSVMIGEEQLLIGGNASTPLGITPTPTLVSTGTASSFTTANTVYVVCVALAHAGWLSASLTNGVPGQIVKTNTDGSIDTFGGGSARPSAEANLTVGANGNNIQATVAVVPNAVAYAWFVGAASGQETLKFITAGNQINIAAYSPAGRQPITALQVTGLYQDNSVNQLVPDGILSQIYGSVFGVAPSLAMSTNQNLPVGVSLTGSGALIYTKASGNVGLTISGTNILEFDALLQAGYDQYKIGYDKILMASQDIANFMGQFLGQAAAAQFRILFDADQSSGRIIAGRRVTSYLNKFYGNTLDIEIHPYVPPGTIVFWSDRAPYELSGIPNILEAHVRMDYYQIQWPFRSRRYEYGVYVDEVFAGYFMPAFAIMNNVYAPTGTPTV